jgi:hypothetical protein
MVFAKGRKPEQDGVTLFAAKRRVPTTASSDPAHGSRASDEANRRIMRPVPKFGSGLAADKRRTKTSVCETRGQSAR